jgi:hypothetical protein
MTSRRTLLLAVAAVAAAHAALAADRPLRVAAVSGTPLADWSARVDRLLSSRELEPRLTRDDTMIEGRRHERLAQVYRGLRVFGGELVRQSDAAGTLSVFGTFYEGIALDVAPRLSPAAAEAQVASRGGRPVGSQGGPELLVLPRDDGYRLAYRIRAFFEETFDVRQIFLDAASGEVLLDYRDLKTQAAGIGTGVRSASPRRAPATQPPTGCGRRSSPPTTSASTSTA